MVQRFTLPKMRTSVYWIFLLALLIVDSQSQSTNVASGRKGPESVLSAAVGDGEASNYDTHGGARVHGNKRSAAIPSAGASDMYRDLVHSNTGRGGALISVPGEGTIKTFDKMRSAAHRSRGDIGRSILPVFDCPMCDGDIFGCEFCGVDIWGDVCETCIGARELPHRLPTPIGIPMPMPRFSKPQSKMARRLDWDQNMSENYIPRESDIRNLYLGAEGKLASTARGRASAIGSVGDDIRSHTSSNYGVGSGNSGDTYSSAYDPHHHYSGSHSGHNSLYNGPVDRVLHGHWG